MKPQEKVERPSCTGVPRHCERLLFLGKAVIFMYSYVCLVAKGLEESSGLTQSDASHGLVT